MMNTNKFLKLFFLLIIPLFLLGATLLVIIITQGGQVTDKGIVNDKGVIRIFTDPLNISCTVYIDNKQISLQNNNSVNIDSGEYLVRLEAENFVTWEKKVIVSKGIVNDIYAKLFSNKLALTKLTSANVSKIFFSQSGEYLFYVVTDSQFPQDLGIWKLQLGSNSFTLFNQGQKQMKFYDISTPTISNIINSTYDIIPSNDGNRILLTDIKNQQFLVISNQQNTNVDSTGILDISLKLGFTPQSVKWMNNFNSLLITQDKSIFEYNLSNSIVTLIRLTEDKTPIYSSNNTQILVFDSEKKVLSSYKNQLLESILPNVAFPENVQNIYLASNNNRFLFLQTSTSFVLFDLEKYSYYDMAILDEQLLTISSDGSSLIFIDKNNKVLSKNIKENIVANKLEITTSFFDTSYTDINSIKFITQSSLILLQNKKDGFIYAYDKDGTNKIKLLDNTNIVSGFDFDNDGNELYVLLVDETTSQNINTSNIYKVSLNK